MRQPLVGKQSPPWLLICAQMLVASASDAAGYRAINTASGTLFKTQLERLPIAIQVMTDELLKDIAVVKVEDALRYTSGVGLANRNEGVGTTERFTIRGFPTGLILRNGVPFTTLTDTVSIERIEVLRGSGSVLYGEGATGGVIVITTKAGNGTVVLSGASANTGNGAVNINAGTLQISKTTANTALGDTSAVTVASGATLSLAAGLSETIGSLAGSGTITAGNTTVSTATLTTGANNSSTLFTGNITNSGNTTLALTKTGNGTLTLGGTGNYTYGGAVNVQNGTLTIQNVNALGTTTNGTTVLGGATLALDLAGSNTIANEALTLGNATTVGTLSSINATGNNTWTGGITLANTGTIQTDAGQFTLATGNITGAFGLNVAGAGNTTISSTIATGVGTLTKSGNGTLTLTGNNTFTGTTTINGGVVYLLVQSEALTTPGTNAHAHDLTTLITAEADIAINVSNYQYGYSQFEYSLLGQGGDAGDLTAIPGFAQNTQIHVSYSSGPDQYRGYGQSQTTIVDALKNSTSSNVLTYAAGELAGDTMMVISPSNVQMGGG
eukprot:gene38040-49869_t